MFRLKTTVETRFVYLYEVLIVVLRHWKDLSLALSAFAGLGVGVGVPTITEDARRRTEGMVAVLKPFRLAVGTLSGSKTVSLSHSVVEWYKLLQALASNPVDHERVATFKVSLHAELMKVCCVYVHVCEHCLRCGNDNDDNDDVLHSLLPASHSP